MSNILAYVIAIAAPILAIYMIFALDLFGTGKGNTIIVCGLWGVFGAAGLAYIFDGIAVNMVGFFTTTTLIAPIIEEFFKSFVLMYFIRKPRFRYFVDGAIYGFAVGMGFAITENIFYILIDTDGEVLALVIKRVLSSSLMHGFASAIVGISLGLMRRTSGWQRLSLPMSGLASAIIIHAVYNNIVARLQGSDLLLVAIGIGLGGGIILGALIDWGLKAEKHRFEETLGLQEGITSTDRRYIQRLGERSIDEILKELGLVFGDEKVQLIRKLLVKQANLGILKNNLRGQTSPRLREAWEAEAAELITELDAIRAELGFYTMMLLRSLLPKDNDAVWQSFSDHVAKYDPLRVNSFDLFMVASKLAETVPTDQLEKTSELLRRIHIFSQVPLVDLENLSRAITPRNLRQGEVLFERGDNGDAMYLIENGLIDIHTIDNYNNPTYIRTAEEGHVVGEMSLIDGQPRSATATANTPARVWMLQRQHFLMFIQSRPHVILAVLEFLAGRLRDTTDLIVNIDGNDSKATISRAGFALFEIDHLIEAEQSDPTDDLQK